MLEEACALAGKAGVQAFVEPEKCRLWVDASGLRLQPEGTCTHTLPGTDIIFPLTWRIQFIGSINAQIY
jgi:hypothetical protein